MKMQGAHLHGGHSHLHKRHGDWSGGGPPVVRPGTVPADSETSDDVDLDPTGSGGSGASTTTVGSGLGLVPSQTGGTSTSSPLSPTSTPGGAGVGGANPGPGGTGGTGQLGGGDPLAGSATSRLPPGAIAGLVVGLFALFTILGLVFYKFRGTLFGQRITQLFSSIGGAGSAALGGAAGAAAAIVSRKEKEYPQDQPQMGEKRPIPSPVVVAPAISANPFSDNHRLSANSPFSDAYRVTTPSPTPPSDAGHLSPTAAGAAAAAVATNKPLPTPPRFSSMTAGSTTSVGTTILSPSVLSFPMPPMTPALTATATTMSPRTPAHTQAQSLTSPFISMEQPGKTVVRITRKPVPGRDLP
ncbi:hypothetical protein B0T18DRAFT_402351 [Schizothecium vesticola]|uniref:Uncharacterized protein n=1 Tax=Schizothecium vesticola TaxID=314040 RepID=A0AA40K9X9_9PEZI|nr:hypothetical protein B0T18DRAFT_402351 [Schizothecium vesticola]